MSRALLIVCLIVYIYVLFVAVNSWYGWIGVLGEMEHKEYNGTSAKSLYLYNKVRDLAIPGFIESGVSTFMLQLVVLMKCCPRGDMRYEILLFARCYLLLTGIFDIAVASMQLSLSYAYDNTTPEEYEMYESLSGRFMGYVTFQIAQIIPNYTLGAILIIGSFFTPLAYKKNYLEMEIGE